MAELVNKYPQNAAGRFYVDDQCIDCDLCRETAPANFMRNDDGGHSYVYKQPESPEEEALCKEAMRVVRSKPSAMTASSALFRCLSLVRPVPQMRTF
jgi:ferredoxin